MNIFKKTCKILISNNLQKVGLSLVQIQILLCRKFWFSEIRQGFYSITKTMSFSTKLFWIKPYIIKYPCKNNEAQNSTKIWLNWNFQNWLSKQKLFSSREHNSIKKVVQIKYKISGSEKLHRDIRNITEQILKISDQSEFVCLFIK